MIYVGLTDRFLQGFGGPRQIEGGQALAGLIGHNRTLTARYSGFWCAP